MSRQRAYLAALEITPWVRRDAPPPAAMEPVKPAQDGSAPDIPEPPASAPAATDVAATETGRPESPSSDATLGLAFGPGSGGCLLLGQSQSAVAGPLASDLARTLPEAPVWCWPDGTGKGITPEAACGERLVTHVLVLGPAVAGLVFGREVPERCGAAQVTVLPSLDELAGSAEARQSCWQALRAAGVVRHQ